MLLIEQVDPILAIALGLLTTSLGCNVFVIKKLLTRDKNGDNKIKVITDTEGLRELLKSYVDNLEKQIQSSRDLLGTQLRQQDMRIERHKKEWEEIYDKTILNRFKLHAKRLDIIEKYFKDRDK